MQSEVSTYKKNEYNWYMKGLMKFLNWLSSKLPTNQDRITIILEKDRTPKFYRGTSSITYIPTNLQQEYVELKLSDWKILDNIDKVKLEDLVVLLKKTIPEIECRLELITPDVEAISIKWKNEMTLKINEDSLEGLKKRYTVYPYRVLAFLEMKPEFIAKGRQGFKKHLVMGILGKDIIIYTGNGATYGFNKNGLHYIAQKNLHLFKITPCSDRIGIIEYREKDPDHRKLEMKKAQIFGNS